MEDQKQDQKQVKENELITLTNRRLNNARMQLKSVVLEMYEIFGPIFTKEVLDDCAKIYQEFEDIKSRDNG